MLRRNIRRARGGFARLAARAESRSFEIDLPVDVALIGMLRPEYREAFSAVR